MEKPCEAAIENWGARSRIYQCSHLSVMTYELQSLVSNLISAPSFAKPGESLGRVRSPSAPRSGNIPTRLARIRRPWIHGVHHDLFCPLLLPSDLRNHRVGGSHRRNPSRNSFPAAEVARGRGNHTSNSAHGQVEARSPNLGASQSAAIVAVTPKAVPVRADAWQFLVGCHP